MSVANPPQIPDSSTCCFCAGPHDWKSCPVVYTPITDCEYKDAKDGCCSHPKNMTPECHVNACPRLHPLLCKAGNQAADRAAIACRQVSPSIASTALTIAPAASPE